MSHKNPAKKPKIAPQPPNPPVQAPLPQEFGGQPGPDPTRYGDWEGKGRCTDF